MAETFTSSPIRFCAAHDLCSLSGNQHRRRSIPSGNPSLVRSFLVFLSASKEAYVVYFICSPMAAAIYVTTALSDYIEIGSNTTTTTTTCAATCTCLCVEKKTKKNLRYFHPVVRGWGDLRYKIFGPFLFSDSIGTHTFKCFLPRNVNRRIVHHRRATADGLQRQIRLRYCPRCKCCWQEKTRQNYFITETVIVYAAKI